jgi:serine/threonine protein kinase
MRLPHRFGRYVLTKKLATGGMAEIYRAKYLGEGGFEKNVAIKRLLPAWSADKDFVTMLIDEAKALVHLQHHNIVQVMELGKEEESFFISMELIEGLDLGALFRRMITEGIVLPLRYTIYILCQILEALDFAHKQAGPDGKILNIVHRDISPPNVLLSWSGEVKVADFGIAKGAHRTYETTVTQVKGKYSYMSPEQATGQVVDHRTDIYAAGILFYELIARRKLFDAPNDLEVIELVKRSEIPPLTEIEPELKKIISRSLKKNRDERYQTAAEFLEGLNQYALKNGLVATGFEFGQFLRETFPNEAARHEEDNVAEKSIVVTSVPLKTRPFGRITQFRIDESIVRIANRIAAFAATAMFAFIPWGPKLMPQEPAAKIEIPPPAPVAAVQILPESALINVNARPWGYVTIPGYVQKKETPVRSLKIKTGPQTVKVYYEPENQWVTAKVDAKSGGVTNCFASFGQNPTLTCK